MEQLFNFQTFHLRFPSSLFRFQFHMKVVKLIFTLRANIIFPETLSSLAFRENFKRFLSSQRIQAASENFSGENSSSLDSENFSSYFGAREIVNREKRKKAFRDVNNEKFEIKLRELLGIHRNDFYPREATYITK